MDLSTRRGSLRKSRGTTLIELIAVLTIVAILTCIALPSLGPLLARHQLHIAQTDVIAALQYARKLAVTTGSRTIVCPTRDGHSCSNETQWNSGWLLGQNQLRRDQPDGAPSRIGHGYRQQINILSTAGRRRVLFQADGSAGGNNITLILCTPGKSEQVLSVVVSNSGRIRGAHATAEQAERCAAASL
ncbi:GspH/FimT family pseudopilin [Dyella silvatica]|uniref:GspH/FimT family pseudopilin n=1 Tax=Dyella silvatica TaxID=2992128 RepID=UPI0022551D86|nr:GspH/FimT family pseudopilin [Dyella silvatica]